MKHDTFKQICNTFKKTSYKYIYIFKMKTKYKIFHVNFNIYDFDLRYIIKKQTQKKSKKGKNILKNV